MYFVVFFFSVRRVYHLRGPVVCGETVRPPSLLRNSTADGGRAARRIRLVRKHKKKCLLVSIISISVSVYSVKLSPLSRSSTAGWRKRIRPIRMVQKEKNQSINQSKFSQSHTQAHSHTRARRSRSQRHHKGSKPRVAKRRRLGG